MDVSLLCRSCMKQFESRNIENYDAKTMEMFCYCTKIEIQISSDDDLPKNFCHNCIRTIELCYNFIKEAQKADIALKNVIARSETVIVKKENLEIKDLSNLTVLDAKTSINNKYKPLESTDNEDFIDSDFCVKSEDCNDDKEIEESKGNVGEVIGTHKYTCPHCQKCFTSKLWYYRHVEKEKRGKFSCPHCSKTFLKCSQLTNHLPNHSQERRFECNVCGKKYKRRQHLSVHCRTHSNTKPYACDKCNMRFQLKSVLKDHMRVHDNQKPYLCPFCGWSFTQLGNLNVHIRTHTGDKPFKCDKCAFSTAGSSSLRRHERSHSGLKRLVCNLCGKTFAETTTLARHKRTHTGELPYKCPCCERAFVDSWKRKTHLMRTHRMSLQDIPRMSMDGRTIKARE